MDYRVDELARLGGVRVDTVRFYQARGLIAAPRRAGRIAFYDDRHLAQLKRIRALLERGLTLAVIKRLMDREGGEVARDPDGALLEAVAEMADETVGARSFSRTELAREAGIPEPLLMAVQASGLLDPVEVDGEPRFGESDLEMARAGLALLGAGFPIDRLMNLAVAHAHHTNETVDAAIELFDAHVRKGDEADPEEVAARFRELLPQLTRLVAVHFQRTLVTRALKRLERKREGTALEAAREAVESSRLDVEVSWR